MEGADQDVAVAEALAGDGAEAAAVGVPESKDADKASKRKDANRVSAKKSRERKANAMEVLKKENETLKAQVAQLQHDLAVAQGRAAPGAPPPPADAMLPAAFEVEGGGDTDAALPIKKQKR
jgi:hypothetical protein